MACGPAVGVAPATNGRKERTHGVSARAILDGDRGTVGCVVAAGAAGAPGAAVVGQLRRLAASIRIRPQRVWGSVKWRSVPHARSMTGYGYGYGLATRVLGGR